MLVAAEASGDNLGAGLMRALKARYPDARFIGAGGAAMAAEGLVSAFDTSELSIIGFTEALMVARKAARRVKQLVALARVEKPDVAVLIDSYGFNIRLGAAMRQAGLKIPLVKYVGPQVWATRPGRAKTLARVFDHLLAILPFDAPFYERHGLPVTFVGNPTLAIDFSRANPGRLRKTIGAGPDDPILLLLPGSRKSEIERIGPAFEDAVARLQAERPKLHVVCPVAPTVAGLLKSRLSTRVHVVEGDEAKKDAMKAATAALACSGTVTTELALAGVPMVVGYRLGALTLLIFKAIMKAPFITLINIAAGKEVAPELLQGNCTGEKLAAAIGRLLDDPALRVSKAAEQDAALDRLGRGMPDPSAKAAEILAGYLKAR